MGAEPIERSDAGGQVSDYCHEIEIYLCKKNDGHLIRVVGPSFDLVSAWASRGVPLKVAFAGIDRYFERYYRNGPRRRPVRVDFCEADVLDVFDEWRRATGVVARAFKTSDDLGNEAAERSAESLALRSKESLPGHLGRILLRLTSARASGNLSGDFDALIDRVSAELDLVSGKSSGVRGEARAALIARLAEIDADMLRIARAGLDDRSLAAIAVEAEQEIAPFRAGMAADAYARARDAAIDLLVRERFTLPVVSYA
jgi:hypothetical protein